MERFEVIKEFKNGYVSGVLRINGKSYKIFCDKDDAYDLISNPTAKIYKIYSRDCRFSDKTHTYVGLHSKSRGCIILYKELKRKLSSCRTLSDTILTDKIMRTGTSTYELSDEEYQ